MLYELPAVSSARAAEIVGIGYEGFRSYLKRGLLGRVGFLPGGGAQDDPAPRSKWRQFGFADLCLARTAKTLMESGFSFDQANAIVKDYALWRKLQHDEKPVDRFLLVWEPFADNILFEPDELNHLPDRLRDIKVKTPCTLINLGSIQRHVRDELARLSG